MWTARAGRSTWGCASSPDAVRAETGPAREVPGGAVCLRAVGGGVRRSLGLSEPGSPDGPGASRCRGSPKTSFLMNRRDGDQPTARRRNQGLSAPAPTPLKPYCQKILRLAESPGPGPQPRTISTKIAAHSQGFSESPGVRLREGWDRVTTEPQVWGGARGRNLRSLLPS
jgi:hypothetical protein